MVEDTSSFIQELLGECYEDPTVTTEVEDDCTELPLTDADDEEILMHRQVHFGGIFSIMQQYYAEDGKGAVLEDERIEELATLESKVGCDLASLWLSQRAQCQIERWRLMYARLRQLCESQPHPTPARLIADLILSEADEEAEAVQNVIAGGGCMVPELVRLLTASELAELLAPGYGLAPSLAARCLGALGDAAAIRPLFEVIGNSNFAAEHEAIMALRRIGLPAQEFLLQQLAARPITNDSERAATALSAFPADPTIAQYASLLLLDRSMWRYPFLISYLAICCQGAKATVRRQIERLAGQPGFPQLARETIGQWGR
jgi:hypothetical protein